MANFLIIFIDSLPYQYALQMAVAKQFVTQLPLTPGFGYSINIQAELFTGKMPDELGYFSEWTYVGTNSPFWKYRFLFKVISPMGKCYVIDRVLHRLGNKIFGPIWNIPFHYLPYLQNQPDIFSPNYHIPSLFIQNPDLYVIKYPDFKHPNRDAKMTLAGLTAMESHPRLFIGLVDLDGITHRVGVGTSDYVKAIEELNTNISTLIGKYQKLYPDGKIVVISDHGMTNVTGSVKLIMETEFGNPSPERYFYIQDSTMLRIWTFDNNLRSELEKFLNQQVYGRIITPEERLQYKLTSSKFGNILFLLNEGLVFSPSFYGKKIPKAMHGYHPELESQKGVLFYNNIIAQHLLPIEKTVDIYKFLSVILKIE
ncbi:MAG: alkaline phosphatase family protein [bacterium]|nr:alkaline phosphatase family protein [bacterium]